MGIIIERNRDLAAIQYLIDHFPVTTILGPRQCGKSTLARMSTPSHYFDLENPADEKRLENPQLALSGLKGLIVIDEIQRLPEIFPLIRYIVDNDKQKKFLILGSASRELIRQGSESLAGRIALYPLSGFRFKDLSEDILHHHWLRGGYPPSLLAPDDGVSVAWRENYIKTYLERDIPQLGIQIPARTLSRFWSMVSHYHGQILNSSELARSFGISDKSVRKYLDILEGTFMIRLLEPWYANLGKRLVKAPKIYLRDSGIFHSLQSIETQADLFSHPKLGASWEGYVIEEAAKILAGKSLYYWHTHNGAEIDLFWQSSGKNWGLEAKYADAPGMTRVLSTVMHDLDIRHVWIIYPGETEYRVAENVSVIPFRDMLSIRD